MNKTIAYLLGIIIIILLIAYLVTLLIQKNDSTVNTPATTTLGYKDISYTLQGKTIKLSGGSAQTDAAPGSSSKITTKYFGNDSVGDLNADLVPDVAFILTQSGGGSGTFYYITAAVMTASGYGGLNGIILGDRIAPQTTEIKDGEIVVNYADRKPGAPLTDQPSVGMTRYYKIEGNQLIEVMK